MNVIVCVKQVPGTTDVKINRETNTIIREGVEAILALLYGQEGAEAMEYRVGDLFSGRLEGEGGACFTVLHLTILP